MTPTQLINCIYSSYLYTGTNRPTNTALSAALRDAADQAELDRIIRKYRENGQ